MSDRERGHIRPAKVPIPSVSRYPLRIDELEALLERAEAAERDRTARHDAWQSALDERDEWQDRAEAAEAQVERLNALAVLPAYEENENAEDA